MSRQRRNFSAKFKSDLVIELLKGEKDLNTLATDNNIQPNQLRNWKKEVLNNASAVFDNKNIRRKQSTQKRLVSQQCKLTGSKKSEKIGGSDYESKFSPKPFDN